MCDTEEPDYAFLESILARAKLEVLNVAECKPPPTPARPSLALHAGAEATCAIDRQAELNVVKKTAIAAYQLLKGKNRAAVDVVEFALRKLESYYCRRREGNDEEDYGETEADATILELHGDCVNYGSIGGVREYKHPITLAKYVMRETDDVLIIGTGANKIAERVEKSDSEYDKESDDSDDSSSTESGEELAAVKSEANVSKKTKVSEETQTSCEIPEPEYKIKTFGVCVYDSCKRLACGSSVIRKRPSDLGRLSACGTLPGCGVFGQPGRGCCALSGLDQALYSRAPARELIEREENLRKALELEIKEIGDKSGTNMLGGVALDEDGSPMVNFTAESFPWAYCTPNDLLMYGAEGRDRKCEKVHLRDEVEETEKEVEEEPREEVEERKEVPDDNDSDCTW